MSDAVLFGNGIGNFVLATPFLQNLTAPHIFMRADDPRITAIRSLSLWPVHAVVPGHITSVIFDRVFQLWAAPDMPEVRGMERIAQPKRDWRLGPHEADVYLSLLPKSRRLPTQIRSERVALPAHKRPIIALANGSHPEWMTKRYPHEYFVRLATMLVDRLDAQLAFLGRDEHERKLGDNICRQLGDRCWNYAARLSAAATAGVLQHCALAVTNDTALMHVADAQNVPIVAIWGWTNWHKNHPYNTGGHRVQCDSGGCRHFPCFRTPAQNRCRDNLCLQSLQPERVFETVLRLWPEVKK
ncbi:MAG: glycosyltransferase family 9 protein [Candidatus Lernaella stagnicola]|nr:glycosyltransferase family 9 protein [Candidatus Lernaella stagnicola]